MRYFGKKCGYCIRNFSLACGVSLALAGCAGAGGDMVSESCIEEASARVFSNSGGCYDDTAEESGGAFMISDIMYMNDGRDFSLGEIADTTENITEMAEMGGIEELNFPIIDRWPENISCVSDGMTAEPLSVPVAIDEPMVLSISCIREAGKIAVRITDADGNLFFDEKKMQTGDYAVTIEKTGDYVISIYAREYFGMLKIEPME
ncbi:MAG: hypothetical protein NC314_13520 [Roseburia sp.]|nr:hypothetical protein [Roseburia sp.]MCM1243857.1 hypothetical protein [Roseburia sp.]